ncbi:rna-directed dna polymerase from mobile element jockey- hypothetical protein [Limosa lapponica baueri]|uniref:Rna-directed dna polymerase from mobile element jockey-like n=1 Tax=Limosa lapponica baueri TaxID=1758121 RepID=A0A2I0UQZ6_LIMLA|nr:rna-directed dna polymerase from mobile element jockey- hypothetical protein [Limosa lapponica baueri]
MEQLILEKISRHMKDIRRHQECMKANEIISNSCHRFTKGKSCLTNLIKFNNEMTDLIDERRTMDIVYINFSKVFYTVCHKILIEKLMKCGLDEQRVRWTECWQNYWIWVCYSPEGL